MSDLHEGEIALGEVAEYTHIVDALLGELVGVLSQTPLCEVVVHCLHGWHVWGGRGRAVWLRLRK
jgi:hypothetical protein